MGNVVIKIPKVKFALLNDPNSKGEKCIYLMVPFSDRYLKKSTNAIGAISHPVAKVPHSTTLR